MRTVKYNDRSNCSMLFCIFPSRCFARLHETSRNFVVSRFHQMSENLTLKQTEVFQFAKSGHNLLIIDQAGTGKWRVVNTIQDDCQQRGLRVSVICLSGIACQVYDPGVALTLYSFYGLGAADLTAELLIIRASSDCGMCERVHNVDVVIWDELSMSSSRNAWIC